MKCERLSAKQERGSYRGGLGEVGWEGEAVCVLMTITTTDTGVTVCSLFGRGYGDSRISHFKKPHPRT